MVKTMSNNINQIKVEDVMLSLDKFPILIHHQLFQEALEAMNKFKHGVACVVNKNNELMGIITDGDIRRKLLKVQKPISAFFVDDVLDHSILNPVTTNYRSNLIDAVELMGLKQIWDLPVIDDKNALVGLLHLHPAIKSILHDKTMNKI